MSYTQPQETRDIASEGEHQILIATYQCSDINDTTNGKQTIVLTKIKQATRE